MTIRRLSYENGTIFDTRKRAENVANSLLKRDSDAIRVLPEGEYDITPQLWDGKKFRYNLLVSKRGEGALRMVPGDVNASTTLIYDNKIAVKPGGRVINLPGEQQLAIIAGSTKDDSRLRIFEILEYKPGRSPERE